MIREIERELIFRISIEFLGQNEKTREIQAISILRISNEIPSQNQNIRKFQVFPIFRILIHFPRQNQNTRLSYSKSPTSYFHLQSSSLFKNQNFSISNSFLFQTHSFTFLFHSVHLQTHFVSTATFQKSLQQPFHLVHSICLRIAHSSRTTRSAQLHFLSKCHFHRCSNSLLLLHNSYTQRGKFNAHVQTRRNSLLALTLSTLSRSVTRSREKEHSSKLARMEVA